jgi:hypothetical protein
MSPERVRRSDDEGLYQPRIHSRWIRKLYRIKLETSEPLTVLVDRALAEFVEARSRDMSPAHDRTVRLAEDDREQ